MPASDSSTRARVLGRAGLERGAGWGPEPWEGQRGSSQAAGAPATRGTVSVDSPPHWRGERHPIVSLKKMTQTVRRSLPFPASFQESCSGIMDRVIRGSMQRQAAGGEPARLRARRGPRAQDCGQGAAGRVAARRGALPQQRACRSLLCAWSTRVLMKPPFTHDQTPSHT